MQNKFFTNFLEKSKILRERFIITAKNEWSPMSVLTELYVQVGHVYTVLKNSSYLEENRKIDDLGDEVSDVVFQLTIIGNMYNFDYENYEAKVLDDPTLEDLIIVLGQLSEAVMEDCGHRFEKPRQGFDTTVDFIKFFIVALLYPLSLYDKSSYNTTKLSTAFFKPLSVLGLEVNNFTSST